MLTIQARAKIISGIAAIPNRYLQPRAGITKIEINTIKHDPIAQNICNKSI